MQCYVDDNPECQTSYDSCREDAVVGLQMRPVDMAYLEACSARRMECMNAWPADSCYSTPARESCVTEAQACLEKPCGEVGACILAAFDLN
ncbi:hypothetical protein [Polyangium sp. 15x6]|uniref:hypothetical protein n=1 Tax=Polyangium sp. 15x6 TaxID=3042687 RepID=UPI00249A24CD|nr:hypothetical protein [Polyangium sp. 15x6]MDI3288726.1 hypothetical protein [Polyangium sp. 15x6]